MIVEHIFHWAGAQPAKPALIHNGLVIDYAALARVLAGTGRFLQRQALPPGGTAVVVVLNLLDAWILMLGLRMLGLDTVCVGSPAAARALGLSDASCVVLTEAELAMHPGVAGLFPRARRVLATTEIYRDLHGSGVPQPPAAGPRGGHILYTSGTTGADKMVLLDARLDDRRNAWRAAILGLSRDTVYHGLDMAAWTTIGYRFPLAVWQQGGTVLMDQRPQRFARFFEHGPSYTCLPGPWLRDLLAAGGRPAGRRFELAFTSGFLPPELAARARATLTDSLTVLYGSTELTGPAMQSRVLGPDDLYWLQPVAERTVLVVDEDGRECPTGVPGELRVGLTDLDCAAYLGAPEASARTFRAGFFLPGDMAVKRPDGRIRILGRSTDVINLQGRKLAPGPIEQELQRALPVDEVCLFSGLSAAGREELVVAVQSGRPVSPAAVAEAVGRMLAAETVRVVVLEQFPRTEAGTRKVRRAQLREMIYRG